MSAWCIASSVFTHLCGVIHAFAANSNNSHCLFPYGNVKALAEAIQDGLVKTCNVPPNDLFQLISRFEAEEIILDPHFGGVNRSNDACIAEIVFLTGRTDDQKRALFRHISDRAVEAGFRAVIPLGILNETHEPPTYYGVERNEVETRIIPTTWRELGFGVHGIVAEGLKYDVGITTGFNAAKLDDPAFGIRSAHQEGQLSSQRLMISASTERSTIAARACSSGAASSPATRVSVTIQIRRRQAVRQMATTDAGSTVEIPPDRLRDSCQ